jgi:hypothetical protein
MFPGIHWQYDKNGELKNENFDASDSLVCVIGWLNKCKYEGEEPKILTFDEKTTENGVVITYTTEFCGSTFAKTIEL